MEVLAARVTDLLQEAHDAKVKEIVESPEYINFEKEYKDETADELRVLSDLIEEADKKIEAYQRDISKAKNEAKLIKEKILGYELSTWATGDPAATLKSYLKDKKNAQYPNTNFDRDKTLRRVEADILLSDVANPEELVRSLVEKLKTDANIK